MWNFAEGFSFPFLFVCCFCSLLTFWCVRLETIGWCLKVQLSVIFVISVVQTGGAPLYLKILFVPRPVICFATSNIFSPQGLSCSSWSPIVMLLCSFPSCCFHRNVAHGMKSKSSPESTGWDPGGSYPSPALVHQFRLLCSSFSHLFSILGRQVQERLCVCWCMRDLGKSLPQVTAGMSTLVSLSGQQLLGGSCRNYLLKENN